MISQIQYRQQLFRRAKRSIKGRLLLATLVLLPLFCGLLGWSLDQAFTASVRAHEQTQLKLQAYALIAAAELEQNQLWLPEQFTENRLNQPSSDLFAVIFADQAEAPFWRSPSAVNKTLPPDWQPLPLASGQARFDELLGTEEALFYLQYSVLWEDQQGGSRPFQFVIFERQDQLRKQIAAYRQSLWGWLAAIAGTITVLQILILQWGLKPIRQVAGDLTQIQQGQQLRLSGRYPTELLELTDSINTLLDNEAQQRERYRNTLADLAHSLKTPLAIMQGALPEPSLAQEPDRGDIQVAELQEQINRIDQIISYQLKRSVSAPTNPFSTTLPIREHCEKVISALHKVYRDKPVKVAIALAETLSFRGEQGDLLELLGNLLDNAFKYGHGEVRISGTFAPEEGLTLCIEDNGPGVAAHQSALLLRRGERADTVQPGQGIGLSVVTDIVSSYGGSMELAKSTMGGLAVTLRLPV